MKRLVGTLVLLVLAGVTTTARAAECRVNGGPWLSNLQLNVLVEVKVTNNRDRIMLEGAKLECRFSPGGFTPSNYEDYWSTGTTLGAPWAPGPKLRAQDSGLRINGTYYSPVPSGLKIATMPDNYSVVPIDVTPYISMRNSPSNPIVVNIGDVLGIMNLDQTSNGSAGGSSIKLIYIAANNFSFSPSTCTINNNNPIEINFGAVHQRAIGTDPLTTPIRSDRRLTYSCPDVGITTPITITYKGTASKFDTGLLVMTNPDVGTALVRGGAAVGVGRSFLTYINNSNGGDDVTFALVRQAGSLPTTGPVTGSGVLVMGVP